MLFKVKDLQAIKNGDVHFAFRNWEKPRVKKGSIINTAVGQIRIENVEQITAGKISKKDLLLSGYKDLNKLLIQLKAKTSDPIYKIKVCYHGEDPRIAMRNRSTITDTEFQEIKTKLDRMDNRSASGPWTIKVLHLIDKHPHQRAQFLADTLNADKDKLKINIRKLKNMGLTQSHEIGYTISAFGKQFLIVLEKFNSR